MEDFLYKTWLQRKQGSVRLGSVLFPTNAPNAQNLRYGWDNIDGHEWYHKFKKHGEFMWISYQGKHQEWCTKFESTIIVNWGKIADTMTHMLCEMFPKTLSSLIVLYASPLSAFVQENPPNPSNTANNKWYLGESSAIDVNRYGPLPSANNGIASKLLEIMQDQSRSKLLFDVISGRNQVYECLSHMHQCGIRHFGRIEIDHLFYEQLFSLFQSLVLNQALNKDLNTQYWFHENCPLDNF
jgi:hypothetical protein